MRGSDYKKRKIRVNKRHPKSGSFPKGLFIGLTVGLLVALMVHIYHTFSQDDRLPTTEVPASQNTATDKQPASREVPVPDKAASKIGDSDLFDILRRPQIVTPEIEEQYILQASSFRTQEDAQALENKIIASGHKPAIYKIDDEGEIWYSVQLGPFQALDDAKEVQMRLKAHRIEVLLKKIE